MESNSFYKYEYGYVNIDNNNIYFTSTGNWSEVATLSEKRKVQNTRDLSKVVMVYIFMIVTGIGEIIFFIKSDSGPVGKVISVFAAVGFMITLKNYFFTELGQRFYIPKSKIKKATVNDNGVIYIEFVTSDNLTDEIEIAGVTGNIRALLQDIYPSSA